MIVNYYRSYALISLSVINSASVDIILEPISSLIAKLSATC